VLFQDCGDHRGAALSIPLTARRGEPPLGVASNA